MASNEKGGERKIADLPPNKCRDAEHNPPGYVAYAPGVYEHVCPRCGEKQRFTVPHNPTLQGIQ